MKAFLMAYGIITTISFSISILDLSKELEIKNNDLIFYKSVNTMKTKLNGVCMEQLRRCPIIEELRLKNYKILTN